MRIIMVVSCQRNYNVHKCVQISINAMIARTYACKTV